MEEVLPGLWDDEAFAKVPPNGAKGLREHIIEHWFGYERPTKQDPWRVGPPSPAQTGNWIGTDGRELKPWAPNALPALTRFRLSAVSESMLREKFRAYRAQPAKAADSFAKIKVGYFGTPFDRLIAEVTVIGMGASFSMSAIAFDLKTGQALDVDAAIADVRAKRDAAQRKREQRRGVRRCGHVDHVGLLVTYEPHTLTQCER